jgi:hypothetical protein
MKSKAGKTFGGFTSANWGATDSDKFVTDSTAFIFSIDRLQVYPVKEQDCAIFNNKASGPDIGGGCLALLDPLNGENKGYCCTAGN